MSKDHINRNFPYAITVQALREGWDCHFAYILCSLAEVHSTIYVEQILGRILRLPKAAWKKQEALNMAYAFAASKYFQEAANALTDALIQNGFERQEAKDLIVPMPAPSPGSLFDEPAAGVVTVDIPEIPPIEVIPPALGAKVIFHAEERKMTYEGIMTTAERDESKKCFATGQAKPRWKKRTANPTNPPGQKRGAHQRGASPLRFRYWLSSKAIFSSRSWTNSSIISGTYRSATPC